METRTKQIILVTILTLILLFFIFVFTEKSGITNLITGGAIASANTIAANKIIFRAASATLAVQNQPTTLLPTLNQNVVGPPAAGPDSSSNSLPSNSLPTSIPPSTNSNTQTFTTGVPPYHADTWDSLYPLAVYYPSNPQNANPHQCTGSNLIGYVDGTNFYPTTTSANTNAMDAVCYDNFICQSCNSNNPLGCNALYQQGYQCMFSYQPANGGQVAPCDQYQKNYVCKE